ncbi:hypothetical protein, partial [Mesorhizobium japonicum]|uniref:hypothetical protein n=1 Tax=Mesorhizobium japonicum TaxID=2066070 RepID=UPI003B5AF0D1
PGPPGAEWSGPKGLYPGLKNTFFFFTHKKTRCSPGFFGILKKKTFFLLITTKHTTQPQHKTTHNPIKEIKNHPATHNKKNMTQ